MVLRVAVEKFEKAKEGRGEGGGAGGATRGLVTTVNFALGKKSRGRVVRPISRGLLSNKLVSERMAMAAADTPGRSREGGGGSRNERRSGGGDAADTSGER